MRRGHHHARTKRDPFEERTIATGDSGVNGRRELALGHVFEFEHVDQVARGAMRPGSPISFGA